MVWTLWLTVLWPALVAIDWVGETFGVPAAVVFMVFLLGLWAVIEFFFDRPDLLRGGAEGQAGVGRAVVG